MNLYTFLKVCATLGTTGACAFDHLREVGLVCKSFSVRFPVLNSNAVN